MKFATAVTALSLALIAPQVHAQAPHIVGTWKLNVAASHLPGPPPQVHVRSYQLAPDGTLIGLALVVNAQGRPNFLQFAAKPDGKDYTEYDSLSLAQLQIDGTKPTTTYSETPIDARTVEWTDKRDGRVVSHGRKWVSEDGKTLTFTALATNANNEQIEYRFVFDRQ
jgi:hypothetical protein